MKLPFLPEGRARAAHGFLRPVEGLEIPWGVVEGGEKGPVLLVTAGVHGSEFTGVETALRLLRTDPAAIRGTLVVLPVLNVEGFRRRSIYVMPEDGKNLNRQFPGDPRGTASQRLAHWLVTDVYPHADATIDCHSGDLDEALQSFSLYPRGNDAAKALAEAFALPVAVEAGGEGYTINAAHRVGVPGIIAEVGCNGLWSEASVAEMSAGVARVMAHLGMLRGNAPPPPAARPRHMTMKVPAASVSGLWYPAKEVGDPVAVGDMLGEIRDLFGKVLSTVRSETAGEMLYRLTSLSVNEGEALLGVGTEIRQ